MYNLCKIVFCFILSDIFSRKSGKLTFLAHRFHKANFFSSASQMESPEPLRC